MTAVNSLFAAAQPIDAPFAQGAGAPDAGEKSEIEGYITGFVSHPGDFKVDGVSVRTLDSTEFEHGSEFDLANGIEVEVEGYIAEGGILLVDEVEFEQSRVKINAVATDVQSDSITLLGIEVKITDLTEIESAPLLGQIYEIEGFQDSTGDILAESIEDSGDTKNILQGLVSAIDEMDETLTLFESPWATVVQLNDAMDFENDDDTVIPSLDDFLALIVPGVTIVKVEDDEPNDVWDEAELED